MKHAGYPPPTEEQYRTLFHRTLHDVVQTLTGLQDEAEIRRLCDMIDIIDAPPPIMTEGAPEVIKALSKKYALAVVTSRVKAYAFEPPLNALKPYFKATVAYEDTENHKPHPEPLLLAANQLDVRPEECAYIGDVATDLAAARDARMKCVLYTKESIDGADARTANFLKLPELIGKL